MKQDTDLSDALDAVFSGEGPARATFSDAVAPATGKVTLKRIALKGETRFQFESFQGPKAFHENLLPGSASAKARALLDGSYRQAVFFCASWDYQIRVGKSGTVSIVRKRREAKAERPGDCADGACASEVCVSDACVSGDNDARTTESHDRIKNRLLPDGLPVPWLVELGIQDPSGRVNKSRYAKYRQINRYLEFIDDALSVFAADEELTIVDFGCGKAYLTFALYDFLVNRKGRKAKVLGLDLKQDVIDHCGALAETLGFDGLTFVKGDIAEYQGLSSVDMVICLHACDTATDAALAKAVAWNARAIMAVPCCHKELIGKMKPAILSPMLAYGLMRERFGSLATDTLRALALEAVGYATDVCEFVETEHTPKNVLIRALKRKAVNEKDAAAAQAKYAAFRDALGVSPWLESVLSGGVLA